MCLLSTVGAVMLIFFDDNPDLIMISWNLMGFPTFIYLTANIDEQCARFPVRFRDMNFVLVSVIVILFEFSEVSPKHLIALNESIRG